MCEKKQPQPDAMYQAGFGLKQEDEILRAAGHDVGLRFHNRSNSIQYSPLLVIMMLEMYSIPDRRSYYLYGTLPPAQNEIMELLRRAKIVVPAQTPPVFGAVPMWEIDGEALRVYANAVCNVSLPEQFWKV